MFDIIAIIAFTVAVVALAIAGIGVTAKLKNDRKEL